MTDDTLVEVRLLGLPAQVHDRVRQHIDALNREFELIRRTEDGAGSTPDRLLTLIEELRERFGGIANDANESLQAAVERGDEAIDLVYRVPAAVADASRQLGDLLDEADAYCEQGEHLLTLKTPTDGVVYRRWFLGEFERQIEGRPPIPWPSHVVTGDADDVSAAGDAAAPTSPEATADGSEEQPLPAGWQVTQDDEYTTISVHDDLDLQSAPTLRNILQDVRARGAGAVRIDLRDCRFVDSVGISVFVSAHHRFAADGDRLELVVSDQVRQLLRLSGLEDVLSVSDA
jgi:anti-sigma B factor antagonist